MSITALALRAFARSQMSKYIAMGMSSRAIQRDLVGRFGRAYRMQNIQSDMRRVTGRGKLEHLLRNVAGDIPVPITRMIETQLKYPAKYRVHARVDIENIDTGEVFTKNISFYDDENRGKDAWLEEWERQFFDSYSQQQQIIGDASIISVEHEKRFPY